MLTTIRKPQPLVTGIAPKEGLPGTKVVIRGENLGVDCNDLIAIRICGVDCLLSADWKSPSKIVTQTGKAKGKGDIIVVTKSGGVGSSTVQFRGYTIQIGPQQESAVWVEDTQALSAQYGTSKVPPDALTADYDNPLGISDEGSDTKFSEEKLKQYFPDGNGNTSSENFSPHWYLLKNHHSASFDDLKAGLNHLKRHSSERSEGPREFLKSNLPAFMDCYDSLLNVHKRMIEVNESGSVTVPLEKLLEESNQSADKLFHEVLNRKDMADKTRNTLNVLQRFRFLFNLPLTIDRNIKKGDYDLVITDYTRARSLFKDSQVQVFRKVYEEVEKRINDFRKFLYSKLMELPSSGEEQKKMIRYLEHLGTPGDPAWECLNHMNQWIGDLLYSSKDSHLAEAQVDEEKPAMTRASPSRVSTSGLTADDSSTKQGKPPQKVLFLDAQVRILSETLPEFWKLGQSYLSGKLFKEVKRCVDIDKHNQFRQMVFDTIHLFVMLTRAALLPHTLKHLNSTDRKKLGIWTEDDSNAPTGWMPICVRYIRAGVTTLSPLELPQDSTDLLNELVFDMRVNCMSSLLCQSMEDAKTLYVKETWSVDADDDRGGMTILPALFENIISQTLQHLQEVIVEKPGEVELFSSKKIQDETAQLIIQVCQTFAGTLEQLADANHKDKNPQLRRSLTHSDSIIATTDIAPNLDKRLIVMMSNCSHMREQVLPRLMDNLERLGYPQTAKIQASASFAYQSLDDRLFDKYIEEKAQPIIDNLERNMYAGQMDWKNCPKPTGVRNYIKEVVIGTVQVHSEVYSISPNFVPRVMRHLIEVVLDEISRLFQSVPEFSDNGAIQGRLELYALRSNVEFFSTHESQAAIQEALNCIPNISVEDNRLVQDLLLDFQSQMKIHLMCLQVER